ncbi:MAG: hypothetical protein MJ085_04425 [Clostridia bacterium]|nr:hypothetical protein [Clostridia bacterium]
MSMRDDWKETGKGLGKAFKDLGQQVSRSAMHGVGWAAETVQKGADNLGEKNGAGSNAEPTPEKPIIDADE